MRIRPRLVLALATAALVAGSAAVPRADGLTADEAHAMALEAYLYLYPLVSMDLTRKQSTNIQAGREFGKGPMNTFANMPEYPPVTMKMVVRPNYDTLYSSAWLDLTKGPVIVSAPDTHGRYYLLPMLDMWTDVFASPGWRTTGTQPATYLIAPPGWSGTMPAGCQRIDAPTPYVWIIGRTKTDGPADYEAVHKIQAGYTVMPLSQWGKPPVAPTVTIDPSVDMKTPPKIQADSMTAEQYFTYAMALLKVNSPHVTDQPILARMARLGLSSDRPFDFKSLDAVARQALADAPEHAQQLMAAKMPTLARIVNGWSMNTDTMGVYGNYYLKRAIVAQFGLGANLPEDAVYPANLADDSGRPLDGASRYRLHFDKAALPPAGAFWSITLYDDEGFGTPNPLNRFALSSWMPMKFNADGSLDVYFQHDSPGKALESNWLPAPAGAFNLTMRLYAPKPEVLTGKWNPPAVVKAPAVLTDPK